MARIAANNAVIGRINNKKGLPDGAEWVASGEVVARGMQASARAGSGCRASSSNCGCRSSSRQ
jgi:hypothetical protein